MKRGTKLFLFIGGICIISIIYSKLFINLSLHNTIRESAKCIGEIDLYSIKGWDASEPGPFIKITEVWSWNVIPKTQSGDSLQLKLMRKIQFKLDREFQILPSGNVAIIQKKLDNKAKLELLGSYRSQWSMVRIEGDFKWHSPQEQNSLDDQWSWNFTATTPGKKMIQIVLPSLPSYLRWERKKIHGNFISNLRSRFIEIPILVSKFGLHPHLEKFLTFFGLIIGFLFTAPLLVELLKSKLKKQTFKRTKKKRKK